MPDTEAARRLLTLNGVKISLDDWVSYDVLLLNPEHDTYRLGLLECLCPVADLIEVVRKAQVPINWPTSPPTSASRPAESGIFAALTQNINAMYDVSAKAVAEYIARYNYDTPMTRAALVELDCLLHFVVAAATDVDKMLTANNGELCPGFVQIAPKLKRAEDSYERLLLLAQRAFDQTLRSPRYMDRLYSETSR
jgi:hypothetical protein